MGDFKKCSIKGESYLYQGANIYIGEYVGNIVHRGTHFKPDGQSTTGQFEYVDTGHYGDNVFLNWRGK